MPLIGNYGVHVGASESARVWPRAWWYATPYISLTTDTQPGTVDEFLRLHGVPGIHNIDTGHHPQRS